LPKWRFDAPDSNSALVNTAIRPDGSIVSVGCLYGCDVIGGNLSLLVLDSASGQVIKNYPAPRPIGDNPSISIGAGGPDGKS
jgi:hypothetical protein